jgi:threonine aldolase
LFNALVETKDKTQDYGKVFDSISICLSKGLGAPVGSLLIGNQSIIKKSRRLRKAMGGGMRQAGYLAAAGIFALENNIERLQIDNDRAKKIGDILKTCHYVKAVRPVESNIIFFDLIDKISGVEYIKALEKQGILAVNFGPQTIRFVTHLDISDEMMKSILETLPNVI